MSHTFTSPQVDVISGKIYQVCRKCKQVLVEGDDFFNNYCVADVDELDGIKKRIEKLEKSQ